MSNVNVKRAVENIRATTSMYTPVVEVIVNAIQAIETQRDKGGKITIRVVRSKQQELDGLAEVTGFRIEDNGVGFNEAHRDSFDTLYSDMKAKEGGKGFGRFTCIKYFEELHIDSVFVADGVYTRRQFSMGKDKDIIANEIVTKSDELQTGSKIWLDRLKKGHYEKKLATLARTLVEKMLPYFITDEYACPVIELCEEDGTDRIKLNAYFTNELADVIQEMSAPSDSFSLTAAGDGEQNFTGLDPLRWTDQILKERNESCPRKRIDMRRSFGVRWWN